MANKKILIAEDERPMLKALELKFSHAGFDVTATLNGKEAIDALNEDGNFDIIVIDLVMPEVDGFEVLEHIKKEGIKTPVIVASNLSQQEDEERARSLGAVGYIIKSNTPINQLVEKVTKTMEEHGS